MKPKTVFEGQTKDGRKYLIRYPVIGDVQNMCNYMNALSEEQTFITFQGEKITLEKETTYLEDFIKKMNDKLAVKLLVIYEDKIVGISDIKTNERVSSHEGVFGITVAKEFRGQGIGKKLMELVFKEAEVNIPLPNKCKKNSVFKNTDVYRKGYCTKANISTMFLCIKESPDNYFWEIAYNHFTDLS